MSGRVCQWARGEGCVERRVEPEEAAPVRALSTPEEASEPLFAPSTAALHQPGAAAFHHFYLLFFSLLHHCEASSC